MSLAAHLCFSFSDLFFLLPSVSSLSRLISSSHFYQTRSSTHLLTTLSFRLSAPLQNHLSCSSSVRSLVSVISSSTTNDPYVSSVFFLSFLSFSPSFAFLLHHAWVGLLPSNPFLYSQINGVKRSRLLRLISMLARVRARFSVRLEMKCLGVDYTTRSISE
jgi:hypothetical protein